MSTKIRYYRTCDLEAARNPASEVLATQTIRFSVGADEYEVDLSDQNAAGFWEAIRPYAQAGRKIRSARRSALTREQSARVREWARKKGYPVSEKGRIKASIVAEYEGEPSASR